MSIPTSTELEKRWWHRLAKIIIWIISGIVALISILGLFATFTDYYGEFNPYALLWVLLAPVAYLLLSFFYRKVILYIAFGRDDGKTKTGSHLRKVFSLVTIIKNNKPKILFSLLVVVVLAFAGYYFKQRNDLRDLRYRAYEANLHIGRVFNTDAYLDLLTADQYSFQSTAKSITEAKVDVLDMVMSDLYELANDCADKPICKEQLSDHIIAMSNSIEAGREYYDKLDKGIDDIAFIRDKAMEMNRAVRIKYLISPDPTFPPFTKSQLLNLIDLQWNVNFRDYIRAKKLCDEVSTYMRETNTYKNVCETDLYKSMFTFNFADGEQYPQSDIQSVCDLEKNYTGSTTCPITLKKVENQRSLYANYLATHKNPYYSVSHFPEQQSANSSIESFAKSKVPMGYQFESIHLENLDDDEEKEAIVFQVEDDSLEPKEAGVDYFRTSPSQFFIVEENEGGFFATTPINTDLSKVYVAQYLHKETEASPPYKVIATGETKWIVILSSQMSFDGEAIKPGLFSYNGSAIKKYSGNMDNAWGESIHFEGNKIYLANGCIFDTPLSVTKVTLQSDPQVETKDLGDEKCETFNELGSEKWLVQNLW